MQPPHGPCAGERGAQALEAALAHVERLRQIRNEGEAHPVQPDATHNANAADCMTREEAVAYAALMQALHTLAQDWCGCGLEACIAYAEADNCLCRWLADEMSTRELSKACDDDQHGDAEAIVAEPTTPAVSCSVDALAATHKPRTPAEEEKREEEKVNEDEEVRRAPSEHSDDDANKHTEELVVHEGHVTQRTACIPTSAPSSSDSNSNNNNDDDDDGGEHAALRSSSTGCSTVELPHSAHHTSSVHTSAKRSSQEPSHSSCVSLTPEPANTAFDVVQEHAQTIKCPTASHASTPREESKRAASEPTGDAIRDNNNNNNNEKDDEDEEEEEVNGQDIAETAVVPAKDADEEYSDEEAAALTVDRRGCIPYTYYAVHAFLGQPVHESREKIHSIRHAAAPSYAGHRRSYETQPSSYFAATGNAARAKTPSCALHRRSSLCALLHKNKNKNDDGGAAEAAAARQDELRALKQTYVWGRQALAQYRAGTRPE